MIRVVLAEDHAIVREGTRHMLEHYSDLEIVGEAADGAAALDLIARTTPDVAILDLRMPKMNAIEVTREAKIRSPATRCLVLTAFDDDDLVLAAIESGVAGYLLKTVRAQELADAVRDVHRGETVLHPEISRRIALVWARRQGPPRDAPGTLTPREMEILELASHGWRNKEIAQRLNISVRTVEGHLSTILAKLEVSSRTAAVAYGAAHEWFRMRPPDDPA